MTYPSSSLLRLRRLQPKQTGVVLMTTVLVLIILTLLALAMYRGFGAQQKIAGNTREKERAFQSAQNALEFGEAALVKKNQGGIALGVGCVAKTTVESLDDVRICTDPLTAITDPENWTTDSTYKPSKMTLVGSDALAGVTLDGNGYDDIKYAKAPQLYVQFLGGSSDGNYVMYSVTSSGSAGGATSRAVVKSVYSVTANLNLPDTNPSQSK